MASVTIFKGKSYGTEISILTVYGGVVAMVKSSVQQGMAASAVAFRDEITLLIASEQGSDATMSHFSASVKEIMCFFNSMRVLSCGKMFIKAGIKQRGAFRLRGSLAIWHKSMSAFRKVLVMCTRAQTCCIIVSRRKATSNI